MRLIQRLMFFSFWLAAGLAPTTAGAHDLVLKEPDNIRVGACSEQIRFQVELNDGGHKHNAGQAPAATYRVIVYSPARRKIIKTFDVTDHKLGDTKFFVVPSDSLICDRQLEIRVDDQNRVEETNKKNNAADIKLEVSRTGGDNPCAATPDKCR